MRHSLLTRRAWLGQLAALGSLAVARSAGAQFPFKHQMHALLQSQLRFLQFRVVMGRIEVTTDDPIRNFATTSKQGENNERLAIEFGSGTLSLDYTLTTPQGDFSVRIVDSREVIVRQNPTPGQKRQPLLFVQPKEGPLQLIVGSGETSREVRAQSLWQVVLAEPEVSRRELFPVLHLLRPDWRLADTYDEIDNGLLAWNSSVVSISDATIRRLVEQLGSDEFAQRELAERQLMEVGSLGVSWLRRLDPARLDAEQRQRIRRLLALLGDAEEDSGRSALRWLAVDPQTWYLLLARDDVKLRISAAEKLSKLLAQPLDFDPQADGNLRREQLSRLRQQIENHNAATVP